MESLKHFPLHPILFGVYPALALMAHNLGQIVPEAAFRSIGASLLVAILLYSVGLLVFQSSQRAAMAVSLVLILFYIYGHIYDALAAISVGGLILGRHRYLFPLWVILATIGLTAIWFNKKNFNQTNRILTIISLVAVAFPVFQFGSHQVRTWAAERQVQNKLTAVDSSVTDLGIKPDIYYIILDGYARHDIMQRDWDFDDSEFLDKLQSLDFVIAECSQSNYPQTELSLPSTLNMDWVSNFCTNCQPGSKDMSQLWAATQHNEVRNFLESLGYTTVSFETGFPWSEWHDADYFFSADPTMVEEKPAAQGLNAFEAMLAKTTVLRPIIEFQNNDGEQVDEKLQSLAFDVDRFPNFMFRVRVLNTLVNMETVSNEIPGPKFVYAHIISPHTPYVFGRNGEMIDLVDSELSGESYSKAYSDQAYYVSIQVAELAQRIIKTSDPLPIIIIQSDHGNSRGERSDRLKNLSAFYLPYHKNDVIYPSLTNVNTFRIIFDAYFNTDYGLLEDQSYLTYPEDPFNWTPVPADANICPTKIE